MSRLHLFSASLGLAAFLFVPLSRVSAEVCYQENFDVGTTPGQSIKDAPISFSIPCAGAGNDQTLVSSPHPGWTGNAIQGSNLTGSSPSVRFKKQIPGMVRGAQSGRWTFKCRAWFNQEESNFVGFGFSPFTCGLQESAFFFTVDQGKAFGRYWYFATEGVATGSGHFDKAGSDEDVYVELTLDYTRGAETISARVLRHDTQEEIFKISVDASKDKALQIYNYDSFFINQGHDPAKTSDGVDLDDITVTHEGQSCDPVTGSAERFCADGIDNDGDTRIDCNDNDCAVLPVCIPEICTDGIDNNENGATDCSDAACTTAEVCFCADKTDNDADGKIDCADTDCSTQLICTVKTENCSNGTDDDSDGASDCADTDCRAAQNCLGPDVCYAENFDVGTTPGQSIKEAPIGISVPCDAGQSNDHQLVSSPHPGWIGNAIRGSNMTGSSTSARFKKKIPGMVAGAQTGRWTFRCRAYFNSEQSNFVGFGFSALKCGLAAPIFFFTVDQGKAFGRWWYFATEGIVTGSGHSNKEGSDQDVDVEITVDYTRGEETLEARVIDHATDTEIFNVSVDVSNDKDLQIYNFDSFFIGQNHDPAKTSDGVDIDDITVTHEGERCDATMGGQERFCTNNLDDDSDGKKDCDDPDCSIITICIPENCTNGVDENENGRTDCSDEDCATAEVCNCGNGLDDDGKNGADCADPACAALEICTRALENCSNNTDDDADGKKDCADPDCRAAPNCVALDSTICYAENFDLGTTLRTDPINWGVASGTDTDHMLVSKLHAGWIGKGIQGSNYGGGLLGGSSIFRKRIPGMVQGAQTGIWTVKCRAWINADTANFVGIGFTSSSPDKPTYDLFYTVDQGRAPGLRRSWYLNAAAAAGGHFVEEGVNEDVDIEVSLEYAPSSESGRVLARVLKHDDQSEIFSIQGFVNPDQLTGFDSIMIRQNHNPLFPRDGIDVDDITVTGTCASTPPENCTNGTDDDFDGKIDCADSDCAGNAACQVGARFFRGDADDNGKLELTDAVRILGFLFLGNLPPTCLDAGDADDNGKLELTDAVRVLGFLFLGTLPPAPPGPPGSGNTCGVDPTPNDAAGDLGCVSYTKC